jgi:hypothetical protein
VIVGDGASNRHEKTLNEASGLAIKYYLAFGSTKPTGKWVEVCEPTVTPDLTTTFDLINLK